MVLGDRVGRGDLEFFKCTTTALLYASAARQLAALESDIMSHVTQGR